MNVRPGDVQGDPAGAIKTFEYSEITLPLSARGVPPITLHLNRDPSMRPCEINPSDEPLSIEHSVLRVGSRKMRSPQHTFGVDLELAILRAHPDVNQASQRCDASAPSEISLECVTDAGQGRQSPAKALFQRVLDPSFRNDGPKIEQCA